MKYKKGQKLYRNNKKTGEIEELEIIDILYVLNRPVKSKYNYNEEELDSLVKDETLLDNIDNAKLQAIKRIEEQFGIKLKEV